ncbi:hypothetical protein M1M86_00985 [Dehalococcoidales bacterium]|nr:hypothetical protein [Dehalococcoidales bacterium]
MKAKSIRQRLRRVEALLKSLDQGEADTKELCRLLPKVKRELKEYKFLLEMLWLWGYK